jgi:hypothetical protein
MDGVNKELEEIGEHEPVIITNAIRKWQNIAVVTSNSRIHAIYVYRIR